MSKVSCEEFLREIEQYLDGELDPTDATVLADHLSTCSPCFDRAEFQRRLREMVRAKSQCAVPDHLVVRVRRALRIERRIE